MAQKLIRAAASHKMAIIARKAQVSMEFLFAIGFVLFVFILLLGFVFQRKSELVDTKDFLDKKAECLRIASLISSVYSGGDGTAAKIKTNYLVTIYNYSIIGVESIANLTGEARCYFVAETESYNLTNNLLIKNEDGSIILTNETG